MSYLNAVPGIVQSAAADIAGIGSSLSEVTAEAAAPTSAVAAAAGDEVSRAIATLFSGHGGAFQALSSQAAAFHSQFVQALDAGAGTYASAEAANAGQLQALAQATPFSNMAISANGVTLFQAGNATANSSMSGLAIAFGANSKASATGGMLNLATAMGTNSAATSQGGFDGLASAVGTNSLAATNGSTLSLARAFGTNTVAGTGLGFLNTAVASGTGSGAFAGYGNVDTAFSIGDHTFSSAIDGSVNFASVIGNASNASNALAGSPNSNILSSFNVAMVLGAGSTADAGATLTTFGAGDLAVVLGSGLTATATGVSQGINIVTPFFNTYLLPLSGLNL